MMCLCSPFLANEVRNIMLSLEAELIDIPVYDKLPAPVSAHPDMLFYTLSDGSLLTDKGYLEQNPEFFAKLEQRVKIRTSKAGVTDKYPGDVRFDVLKAAGVLYGRIDFAAPEAAEDCERTVMVRQGYARCSTLYMGNAAVTADAGLYRALNADGIETLLISSEGIRLKGYDCGFIGGASAYIEPKKTVVFFGDISCHPDFKSISDFITRKGHDIKFPKGLPLCDFGSVVALTRDQDVRRHAL